MEQRQNVLVPAGNDHLFTAPERFVERPVNVVTAGLTLVAQGQPEDDSRRAADAPGGKALRERVRQGEKYTSGVARTVIGLVGIALLAFLAVNLLFSDDRDRVEDEMERLIEVAERGGEEAVAEILDALADDYRGSGWFARKSLERRLRAVLIPPGRLTELRHGDFDPVVKGDEIVIPLVSLRARIEGNSQQVFLAVTFAFRDDVWKIVNVTRWQMGRN